MSRYGSSQFSSLLKDCVLWWPGSHCAGYSGDFDEFPIIPSGVTVTNYGSFTKTDLGNNKQVLNFDGSTNYISLSDNDAWDCHNGTLTVCWWMSLVSVTDVTPSIISQMTSVTTPYNFWKIYWNSADQTIVLMRYNAGTVDGIWTAPASLVANTKFHFAVTKTGSATPQFYLNGSLLTTTVNTTQSSTSLNYAAPLIIGAQYLSPTVYCPINGNLAHLMIFKGRALTQDEIKLLMNRTHPITGRGLIDTGRYYRLS